MHIMVSGVSSGCDNMESQNLTWVHYGTIQPCVTILQPKQEKFLRHPQTPLETSLRNHTCTHTHTHIQIYMYLRAYMHTHLQPEALSRSSKQSRWALPNKKKEWCRRENSLEIGVAHQKHSMNGGDPWHDWQRLFKVTGEAACNEQQGKHGQSNHPGVFLFQVMDYCCSCYRNECPHLPLLITGEML